MDDHELEDRLSVTFRAFKPVVQATFVANGLAAISLLTTAGLLMDKPGSVDQLTLVGIIAGLQMFGIGVLSNVFGMLAFALAAGRRFESNPWWRHCYALLAGAGMILFIWSAVSFWIGIQYVTHGFWSRFDPNRDFSIWPF
ncbi:MAG: hypothetical protein WD715_02400 [Dongiaceae bacterium]